MNVQKPKGTQDLMPGEVETWQFVETKAREICRRFNYREIRTPVFEHTELFLRSVGETTDIVQKEMYTFMDKGDRSMTLRPEGTAGVVRAYVENKLYGQPDLSKLFYIGPMFRYEQPQAGRYRQLHQFGIEAFGGLDPRLDAEVIALGYTFYNELGIRDVTVEINSIGTPECREAYRTRLQEFFAPVKDQLCSDCRSRYDRNPMRILDCKKDQPLCEGAPVLTDDLDEDSRAHFAVVQEELKNLGIPYRVNPRLVRGLDYYTHSVFEYKAGGIGAIDTIGAGGRYNGLVEQIGGQIQPGVGLGIGLERTMLILQNQEVQLPLEHTLDVYAIAMGDAAAAHLTEIIANLRTAGFSVDRDYQERKMKAQLKSADRMKARFTVILGEDELGRGEITLKDMAAGEQETISLHQLIDKLNLKLGGTTS